MKDKSIKRAGTAESAVSVEQMKRSDAHAAAHGVPGEELMHRAALGVFHAVDWRGRIAIVCGGGNNGGDGYALACILVKHGMLPTIYRVGDRLSDTAAIFFNRAKELGIDVFPFEENMTLARYDTIVDCIFGTGFKGEVRGLARNAILAINASGAYVVSVDINSGLDGDTGKAGLAVVSDLTVSIGYYKKGMFACEAKKFIGALVNADIGIPLA